MALLVAAFAGAKCDAVRHLAENVRHDEPLTYAALFALYFACTCIIACFNAALVLCALQSFAGKEPSLRAALAWTFVAATVGVMLNNALQNFLKDRLGFLEAVKRSSSILRRTWGEAACGEGGLGAISVLLVLPLVLVIGFIAVAGRALGADAAIVVALAAIIVPCALALALTVVFTASPPSFAPASTSMRLRARHPRAWIPLLQAAFRNKPASH
jgi:Family of unknown function (DUF6159)